MQFVGVLPRIVLTLDELHGPSTSGCAMQSKAVFSRLVHELKANNLPVQLLIQALTVSRSVGWPSAVVLQDLVARLTQKASSTCRLLSAPEQEEAAVRSEHESNLASALCLLCHTLRAATVLLPSA